MRKSISNKESGPPSMLCKFSTAACSEERQHQLIPTPTTRWQLIVVFRRLSVKKSAQRGECGDNCLWRQQSCYGLPTGKRLVSLLERDWKH